MVIKHLTDDEVQQFVIDKPNCEKRIVEHIHLCEECRSKVEVYQIMIIGIKQQSQAAFDFDLSKMVLLQLPMPQPKTANDKLLIWMLVFLSLTILTSASYYFLNYSTSMFEGVATILIYLIGISAITVIAALVFDMYKKYQKEMKVLDLY